MPLTAHMVLSHSATTSWITMQTARRLVETSEMMRIICELSASPDQVRLSCASRLFFKIAAPVIWESVAGVHNLLMLFPGVKAEVGEINSEEKTITIPTGFLDFERFRVYAPWLLSLWSTLQNITWDNEYDDDTGLSESASETIASGLNGLVGLLRQVSQAKMRVCPEPGAHASEPPLAGV
ncbi:hypothetical protein BDV93DRAFT_561575 [Ceratobasidium sp. AG-I]|nr:hypothetical protein BDV93DRAFT_561575 [Ceratobasidium sp. AG-I]